MQEPVAGRAMKRARAIGDEDHQRRRGQSEPRPCGEAAEIARTREPDREAGLAACRSRQELGERDQFREGALVEPGALDDKLAAEIAEMGDRPAEAGEAQLEKDAQDLEGRAGVAGDYGRRRTD